MLIGKEVESIFVILHNLSGINFVPNNIIKDILEKLLRSLKF